jgi:KaiC/GvpD/RAD55 family RecA-like ATPase
MPRLSQLPTFIAGRLRMGIDVLDRKLDGGVPPGSIVAYVADPASQSELLLYELTAARRTLYLTTQRSTEAVEDALARSPATIGNPTVRRVAAETPLEDVERFVSALTDETTVIVDVADVLERTPPEAYVDALNALKSRLQTTGSVAVLHCLRGADEPANRTRTLHAADAAFDLRTESAGSDLETRLSIPKLRSGRQPTEAIKLELTEAVSIDTSRDIA